MSKSYSHIFTSESVGEGHPDKVADYISDTILDACLSVDPDSRVACETLVKSNVVIVAGEITTKANLNIDALVRSAIREIGYTTKEIDDKFNAEEVFINNLITKQSPDIAQGVDKTLAEGKDHDKQGAGDQGIMFGYATNETEELMPAPVMYAHRILKELAKRRKSGNPAWLRPDCKSQVTVQYDADNKPVGIDNIVISTQHTNDVSRDEIRDYCRDVVKTAISPELLGDVLNDKEKFLVNPTGLFVVGGPHADTGLTGRKIIVDTYGGMGHHGGGAFSGKDSSKVDRSAAYMCRWVAKHIVAASLADRCELQVAYAIGHPKPVSILINTFGTAKIDEKKIEEAISSLFSFVPEDMVAQLKLKEPIFRQTTFYGHFGKDNLPWETLDSEKLQELTKLLG
ncbi:MAG: methionine adenosyltransferase [Akkermansia sp.]|nr:methionine adenosyltransferase [Akkermansia sp.]